MKEIRRRKTLKDRSKCRKENKYEIRREGHKEQNKGGRKRNK
jgi:hypothetical protein